ncbi:MAG: hypothetical protein SGJ20_12605 [Planctomycetota bacterium]|nr:hypothetical protein [Planctomycetota bacterium]
MTQLNWHASFSTTALYAARRLIIGGSLPDENMPDESMAAALAEPAERLRRWLARTDLPPLQFWNQLLALSATVESNQRLASTVLLKLSSQQYAQTNAAELANRIGAIERALLAVWPTAAEELITRILPLREQWEARGPGLLAMLRREVPEPLIPDTIRVLLVQPFSGGAGLSVVNANTVVMEGVLANPHASLPEVTRLAWLISQLNLDLPPFQTNLRRDRALELGSYALIPITLAAGEEVELTRCDLPTLQLAMQQWCEVPPPAGYAAEVWHWWETYQSSQSSWPAAIGALDQMLPEIE